MIKEVLLDNLIVIFMIIAVIIGIGLGFGLRDVWEPSEKRKIFYLEFPGQLLLSMLKLLILPLIVSSIITALATMDNKSSGRIGLGAIVYYLTTTLIAVILGIILVVSIQPGFSSDELDRAGSSRDSNPLDSLLDLIRNCFPPNIIEACFSKLETQYTETTEEVKKIITNVYFTVVDETTQSVKIVSQSGMNILGLVVFSVFFGSTINHVGEKAKPLRDLFEAINDVIMVLVRLVIWFSPIGIMFLIAAKFVAMESPEKTFTQLGLYFGTVIAGLFIHGAIILPLIYFVATRKNPFVFLYRMLRAIITAWGTASSSATLPITMDCLINKNGVNPLVAKFVAPIGATINMDGTALYEAVAAIFIAQANGITLGIADIIIVSLTSTAAAIGAAGVPQAGLVTMLIVLTAVGLPTKDVTLILAIDWLLDRFRTAINVIGDSIGAGILSHVFRNYFNNLTEVQINETLDLEMDEKKPVTNGKAKSGIDNPEYTSEPSTKL
ncbi:hypothetical protein LOTGIDRAFT_126471 [Lottia gigantea]|uniref:Amino acid transporter n=1 Tax=Lottia gigantea TaxID=225164 RepID=V3ZB15_LOTGI|nr:hypothetical protein LOTGIDRAFT_126471 [Lottia gigantea]ESO88193.1 hypothetical protein LOTGIDRAFT_126471 [Lottia gigantea]